MVLSGNVFAAGFLSGHFEENLALEFSSIRGIEGTPLCLKNVILINYGSTPTVNSNVSLTHSILQQLHQEIA